MSSESPIAPEEHNDLVPLDALQGLESAIVEGFLNLDVGSRSAVIESYTRRHGDAAGVWLQRAAELWPQQRLGVSRVTLARLFGLLPLHMNQAERLRLAKSIWHIARAPSTAVLRVPAGYRNHNVLSELVREHFLSALPSVVELPESLRASVPWLDDPEMQAQHDVLNLLLLAERDQLLLLADEQIQVLFARRFDGLEIRSSLTIAGHQLELRTDNDAQEPQLRLRNQRAVRASAAIDTRASKSAFVGALIGGFIAASITSLVFWLN